MRLRLRACARSFRHFCRRAVLSPGRAPSTFPRGHVNSYGQQREKDRERSGRSAPITPNWRIIGAYLGQDRKFRRENARENARGTDREPTSREIIAAATTIADNDIIVISLHILFVDTARYFALSACFSNISPERSKFQTERKKVLSSLRRRAGRCREDAVSGAQRARKINQPAVAVQPGNIASVPL